MRKSFSLRTGSTRVPVRTRRSNTAQQRRGSLRMSETVSYQAPLVYRQTQVKPIARTQQDVPSAPYESGMRLKSGTRRSCSAKTRGAPHPCLRSGPLALPPSGVPTKVDLHVHDITRPVKQLRRPVLEPVSQELYKCCCDKKFRDARNGGRHRVIWGPLAPLHDVFHSSSRQVQIVVRTVS